MLQESAIETVFAVTFAHHRLDDVLAQSEVADHDFRMLIVDGLHHLVGGGLKGRAARVGVAKQAPEIDIGVAKPVFTKAGLEEHALVRLKTQIGVIAHHVQIRLQRLKQLIEVRARRLNAAIAGHDLSFFARLAQPARL